MSEEIRGLSLTPPGPPSALTHPYLGRLPSFAVPAQVLFKSVHTSSDLHVLVYGAQDY